MSINLFTTPDVAVNRLLSERAASLAQSHRDAAQAAAEGTAIERWFDTKTLLTTAAKTSGKIYGVFADESRSGELNTIYAWDGVALTYKFTLLTGAQKGEASGVVSLDAEGLPLQGTSFFNVRDPRFGAKGDYSVDDTAAIRAAIAAAMALGVSHQPTGGVYSGSVPTVYFPRGRYKVTGALDNGANLTYIRFAGDGAILDATGEAIKVFDNVNFNVGFQGLAFLGGTHAIYIETENLNTDLIRVDDCEFQQQTTACIGIATGSNSTQLIVTRSKFLNKVGKILETLSGDEVIFRSNWVTYGVVAGGAAFDITDTKLILDDMLGVPSDGGAGASAAWVDARGISQLYTLHNRYGGENGGVTDAVVRWYGNTDTTSPQNPSALVMQHDVGYSTGTLVRFFGLPNIVDIDGMNGFLDTGRIVVDASCPTADLQALGGLFSLIRVRRNLHHYTAQCDGPDAARLGFPLVDERVRTSTRILTADLVLQTAGNTGSFTPTASGTATKSVGTDEHGVSTDRATATADGQFSTRNYTTMLSGLAAGLYTVVFDIEVLTDHIFAPLFKASRANENSILVGRGQHTISIPFYYDGVMQNVGFEVYDLENTASIELQRIRIVKGHRALNEKRSVVAGPAVPVSGQWYKGDEVVYVQPAASGSRGSVCIAQGSPGTWKTWGTISA